MLVNYRRGLFMIIKTLELKYYKNAIKLKCDSWDEELAGKAINRINIDKELEFFTNWVTSEKENNDIRLVYGAFEDDIFLGFIGASIAEEENISKAIELNYLFVDENYRGRGISLKLLLKTLNVFSEKGFDNLIVYNHHYAPSNSYYLKLGGKVIKKEIQGQPLDYLEVDVFYFLIKELKIKIQNILSKGEYNV